MVVITCNILRGIALLKVILLCYPVKIMPHKVPHILIIAVIDYEIRYYKIK